MCSHARRSASKQWVRQFILVIIYLSVIILVSVPIASSITLYPFDVTGGDLRTAKKDDGGSPLITLDLDFPFYNVPYRELYVNNNGIISFEDKLQSYKPQNFTSLEKSVPLIAPFWADIDIEHVTSIDFNETVVYRIIYNDSMILADVSDEIRTYFVSDSLFSADLVLIVTWYKVGFYGASGDDTGKALRNTFQAVLATDGHHSYAIFNYLKIVWTTGSNSGGETETGLNGDPAVVGFHSGHNSSVYTIAASGTDDVVNVDQTSNVNIPGKWVFRVDGATIDDLGCFTDNVVRVVPKVVSMLGREAITIKGACLSSKHIPKARFLAGDTVLEVSCSVTDHVVATCVTPSLFRIGMVQLEFDPDGRGWKFIDHLTSIHLLDTSASLVREKPDDWLVGKMVTASWEPNRVPEGAFLEVLGYRNESIPEFHVLQTLEDISEGSTQRKFKLWSSDGLYNILVVRLCWYNDTNYHALPLCIWSDVFPVRWQKSNSKQSQGWCEKWINREKTLSPIVVETPNCPCTLTLAENDPGHFHTDPDCDKTKHNSRTNCIYNKNAQQCMQRNLKSATRKYPGGETCCYANETGILMDIRGEPGAGTHLRYHYRAQGDSIVPFFSYYESDLLPRLHCCVYSYRNCSNFLTFRNATICAGYRPPSPALAAGDPHLATLDGKEYSFNGVGDFILVQDVNSSVVIQVRAEQATDKDGILQKATIFTSVAMSAGSSSDVVEVRKHSTENTTGADVLVNGNIATIDSTTSHFNNISVQKNSTNEGSYLIVLEPVSVSINIEVTPDLLNLIVLIGEESLKGNLRGLLGNYNGLEDDDFISRNGTVVTPSASERQLHYDFGMTWAVPANELLLSTPPQDQPVFHNEPIFIDELLSSADMRPGTSEICGTNKQCQYDYQVTGKQSVAESTVRIKNEFDALKQKLAKKVVRCPFINPPENGNRTVYGYSNGSIAMFTCDIGYQIIGGNIRRVCQEDSTWSGTDLVCALKIETGDISYSIYIIVGSSGAGLAVVLITVCLIIVIYRKMKRRKPPEEPPDPVVIELEPIPVFANPVFLQNLHSLVKDGRFRIPRPDFVDPSIFQEYF